jgi:hypothetical protein
MKRKNPLGFTSKLTVIGLAVAALGVIIQIAAGADYPTVPPVFFILLVPALLIIVLRWRATPLIAILAGLFLTFGLFASGEFQRLTDPRALADTIGLWIQMLEIIFAIVTASISLINGYRKPG